MNLGLLNIASQTDGKDILCETSRKNRVAKTASSSNKMGGLSAMLVLKWSLPMGLAFKTTPPFLARVSEKKLNELWCSHGRLVLPEGYAILADKGFDMTAVFYVNCNPVLTPAFLRGQQFSWEQVGHNLLACQLRYSCETIFKNLTHRKCLAGIIRRENFCYVEDYFYWGLGQANMYRPTQIPMKYESLFKN